MHIEGIFHEDDGMDRRTFLAIMGAASIAFARLTLTSGHAMREIAVMKDVNRGEDVFSYVQRMKGRFDLTLYRQVIGSANAFKEGDQAIGVGAADEESRMNARTLLENTKIKDLYEHPLLADDLQRLIWKTIDPAQYEKVKGWSMGQLKTFLLGASEPEIRGVMAGLTSETIGCVPKLMTDEDLVEIGQRIYNPLPGTRLGAKGYMGSRIQPNSPTDHPEDIVWQVFDAFAYATGDIVIGTNPVDGQMKSIAAVEEALKDVVDTFKLQDAIPWCVLSHIDVQAEVGKAYPGRVATMFQSLAGTDDCNKIFNVTVKKILDHARSKKGERYGLYFETGQGAEFTNGAANGVDMMVLESRKYGFARAVMQELAKVQPGGAAWLHVNDVAGFIGPEVFKTREQLVRCCLEDIAMGKLHGLTIGLDICSTLHMAVTLDDLDWCQDRIMLAAPAYLMGLPTKNDPMLSYLTTSYQDHVRLRQKFGTKVNDTMWDFFKRIGIVDGNDRYTEHFGDPVWVYYQYCLAKGDRRSREAITGEGRTKIREVEARGVDIATGHGKELWDLNPQLDAKVKSLYEDAKVSLRTEFRPEFIRTIPDTLCIATLSKNRDDYIAHPEGGEALTSASVAALENLRTSWGANPPEVQIVISDGLNARAIMDDNHLAPYLDEVAKLLAKTGIPMSETTIVVTSGRVRAGYRIGELLFGRGDSDTFRGILHIIGERPGTMHHSYSIYITVVKAGVWAKRKIDHDITKLVSNVADTALDPREAARDTLTIMRELLGKGVKGT